MKMYRRIAIYLDAIDLGKSQKNDAMIAYNQKSLGKIQIPHNAKVRSNRFTGGIQGTGRFDLTFYKGEKICMIEVHPSFMSGFVLIGSEEFHEEFEVFLKKDFPFEKNLW